MAPVNSGAPNYQPAQGGHLSLSGPDYRLIVLIHSRDNVMEGVTCWGWGGVGGQCGSDGRQVYFISIVTSSTLQWTRDVTSPV